MKIVQSFLPDDGGSQGDSSFQYGPNTDNSEFLDWMCDRIATVGPDLSYNVEIGFDDSSDAVVAFYPASKEAEYEAAFADSEEEDGAEAYDDAMAAIGAFHLDLHHRRFTLGESEDDTLAEHGIISNFQQANDQMTDFYRNGIKNWTVAITINAKN